MSKDDANKRKSKITEEKRHSNRDNGEIKKYTVGNGTRPVTKRESHKNDK